MTAGWGEGIAGRNVCEAHERTHEGELPRVIDLRPGMRLPVAVIVGSASFRSWPRSIKFQGYAAAH
jgi:hypothetical protein